MRYVLRAPVEGNLLLEYPLRRVSTVNNDLELLLETTDSLQVTHASASIIVPAERLATFRSSVGPGAAGTAATFHIGGDRELYERLLKALQDLEVNLAFFFPGNALSR